MRDFRAFANEKYVSTAWTRCVVVVWTCLTLWSINHGENLVALGDGGSRAPTNCPGLLSHCQAQVPWACPPTKSDCFKSKQICQSSELNSAHDTVNLTTNIFYFNKDQNNCQQALNLTWTTRLNDYVGFVLNVTSNFPAGNVFNHEIQKELIIDKDKLTLNGGNINDPFLFYYDCLNLSIASVYDIGLYGLHNNPASLCLHQELIGVARLVTDCEADAKMSIWEPKVNFLFSDGNSAIQVYFTPAPLSFKFNSYTVLLWSEEGPITRQLLGNASSLHFSCTIRAYGGHCPCKRCNDCRYGNKFSVFGSTYQCPSEILFETQPLEIPTPYVAVTSGVARLLEPETITSTVSTEKISIIIMGSIFLAAVLIGAVVIYITLSRNYKGVNEPLKRKQSVLLIYAKDNVYHCNAVHCLAMYLQQRCYCEVKLDQWFQDEISDASALDWVLLQIRSVDNVIIVNSEAGWRHYEGNSRNVAYHKIRPDTPLEDFFLFSIKELHGKRQRVFKVAFPYTDSSYFINSSIHAGRTYVLMRHIEDLVLDIQRLSKHDENGKKLALDISASNYTWCEEGRLLEAAVKQASEFFLSNPDWFAKFYYQRDGRHEPLPRHDHPSTVFYDSGLGPSIEQMSNTSNVLKVLLGNEGLGINCYYPPSSLDDDSNSMSISSIEEIFESMNAEYEKNAITY